MSKIDLHMHSIYSCDGQYTPKALVEMAKEAGIYAIAVTDHNTTAGVNEALKAGENAGIEVIPAVELDCIYKGKIYHVLGYFIDQDSKKFIELDENIRQQEIKAAKTRIRLINEMGIPVDEQEAMAAAHDGFVTAEIIAEIVLSKPENAENSLLKPYLKGGSRSDNPYVNFYWDYCAQGKPAYVHIDYISMAEAIEIIDGMKGIPVLAHPGNNLKGREEMLPEMVKLGIRGIEAYSSYHTNEQCEYFAQKAKELGIIITGGSDYHGKTKPSIAMGSYGLEDDGLDILADLKALRR